MQRILAPVHSPRIFPPGRFWRASALTACFATSLAHAQGTDSWSTFPSTSTPAAGAASEAPSAPSPAPTAEATTVSTQERILPGGEPHTPATLHNGWIDARNLRHTASAVGGVGLLRVAGADPGTPRLLRFSLTGEFFQNGDFPVQGASHTRTSGSFALAYAPFEFLEVFTAYTVTANTNSRASPQLIQSLGDLTLGARGTKQWLPGLWAGADLRLLTFSGVGNQDVDRYAFGFAPRLIATYDVPQIRPEFPLLRVHGNLGFLFDGTGDLAGPSTLNASEEYGLGVNRYHRFSLGLGVEAPLRAFTPFLEFNLASPLGVEDGGLIAPDGRTVSALSAAQKTFGLGAKVTALKDVTFSVGAEFGLSRTVGLGVPATPPVNVFLGASYTVDPFHRAGATRVIETVREKPVAVSMVPRTVQVSGVVIDAKTRQPLPGVLVLVPGSGLPPVATEPQTGRFLSYPLPSGITVRLALQKEGYKHVERDLTLTPDALPVVEVSLEAMARPATLTLSTTVQKKPVAAALRLKGPKAQELSTSASAPTKLEVPPGHYRVEVIAPSYLAQTRDMDVAEGGALELSFDLKPLPGKPLVTVTPSKLELQQPVQFVPGKAVLQEASQPLLAEVLDAIVRHGLQRVRIESHTDNQGNPDVNLKLSQERAQAVATFLTRSGLDAARLEVQGFGDTRPIAPNLTPRGKDLNRRVEFIILER
ncbi:Outer membrane protein OmpA [Stigmatella aurantiaca]|uniref:Outer membrane protein OmpA n=1 Tax=Stigmatella aurantiaca TaxID=41 RepID=A0A1H7VG38_STIAU|nr:OmpA family protein [Stigmatella aurantiaca]SEM07747.1 Outer membrane protein OmpA [Stigmatella aurantiaca]